MAKKEEKVESTALTTLAGRSLERPSHVSTGTRGTEHLTREDITMPRLALAQQMSPQLQELDPKYVPDLKVGQLFNSLTGQNFGRGPVFFTIVRADKPRYVQFAPREEGGGVIDPNVPADDPRTRFRPDGKKPLATKFYDFIVAMLPFNEKTKGNPFENMIALSFKSTGLKVAKQLNTLMRMRNADSFTGLYELTAGQDKNTKGTFAVYQVKNAGWLSAEECAIAEAMFESVKDREIKVDREPGEDDDPGDPTDRDKDPSEM